MLRLANKRLPAGARDGLRALQAQIDDLPTYQDRVEAAKTEFTKGNTKTNPIFREVRNALKAMCAGQRRCCYCEDSLADELEHIRPKDLYPEAVSTWTNYLYACGPCNGPKNNNGFAISISAADGPSLSRSRASAPIPLSRPIRCTGAHRPAPGGPAAVPRSGLAGTFHFVPSPTAAPGSAERARDVHHGAAAAQQG